MKRMKVSKLLFKAGSTPGTKPLEVTPGVVTIFVGPNNSGKSMSINELEKSLRVSDNLHVIDGIKIDYPENYEELEGIAREIETTPPPDHRGGNVILVQRFHLGRTPPPETVRELSLAQLENWFLDYKENGNDSQLRQGLVQFHSVKISGTQLSQLIENRDSGSFNGPPNNYLMNLHRNPELLRLVRKFCLAAFPDLYFIIDNVESSTLKMKMSRVDPDPITTDYRSPEGLEFHRNATELRNLGTGVQLFVGMVAALLGVNHRFVLLDDPDVFLHPPLARLFGHKLYETVKERNGQLFVATHSADFVYGCIEASKKDEDVVVIRLTYDSQTAGARELGKDSLRELKRYALLRATRVYQAFFHRGSIVTEGDDDRVFYEVLNGLLLEQNEGLQDVQFIQAYGKDNVHSLVTPLRNIGVPTVAIVDFDALLDESTFQRILTGCVRSTEAKQAFESLWNELIPKWKQIEVSELKMKGVSILSRRVKGKTMKLIGQLADHGFFVVPFGPMESWLKDFGITSTKSRGVRDFLMAIDKDQIQVGKGRVWGFMASIENWMKRPNRKGMD
jgi:energy-coupling factor transporter ATP-binding protein EcfA2